tara:strand:- start:471 stop:677 length:207 start_codon:yes stop_codon:yes gene_type:complete
MTNEQLGVQISQKLRWSGEDILEVFQAALEDANYHTFNAIVGAAWKQEQEKTQAAFEKAWSNNKETSE